VIDNPCIDPLLISTIFENHIRNKVDYTKTEGYPIGLNVEVFNFNTLEKAYKNATKDYEKEHVTPYINRNPQKFKINIVKAPKELYVPDIRITLDTEEDYALLCAVYDFLYPKDKYFNAYDIVNLFNEKPWLKLINKKIIQKKGKKNIRFARFKKSKGFYRRTFIEMKVFIITEGSKNTGFGHITRCLSLYQAFEERGILPEFIINGDNNIEYLLQDVNYQIFNWLDEKSKLFERVKDADIAIIDSYLADISVYNTLSNLVKSPLYIDDNKRLDYPKGIVLNGSIHAKKLNYPKKEGISYLLGTKYTPLRKEFWEVPEKKIKENIESIMVTFGGDDAKNMTPKIMNLLNKEYSVLKKNIIIGKAFNNIEEIKKNIDKNTNLIYYPDAGKMKEVMLNSDIAISAGGQTLYELARIGVPTIGICVAENQLGSIREWEKIGFLEFEMDISVHLKYLKSKEIKENKSKIGRKYIDGKGSLRIIDEIEGNI